MGRRGRARGARLQLRGQVLRLQRLPLADGGRELQRVLELAHVPGPVVGEERAQRLGREAQRAAGARARTREEEDGDGLDVLSPLAQRRQLDGEHLQPIVEVLAEGAGRHALAQVPVGGGDDTGVGLARRRLADALVAPLLQDAQELHLEVERDVAHLVQEEGAVVGELEPARPVPHGASEGAAHVAEELALQQLAGERGRVHRHERSVAPGRVDMEGARQHLLPGSALAGDEDARLAVLQRLDEAQHARHGGRAAEEPRPGRRLVAGHPGRIVLGRAHDEQVDRVGIAHAVGVVLQRRSRDGEEPRRASLTAQEGAPALALLARQERLAERAPRREQLGPEHRLDGMAGDALRRTGAEQRVELVRDVAHPELRVERHADASERPEGGAHGGEGGIADVGHGRREHRRDLPGPRVRKQGRARRVRRGRRR